MDYLQLETTQIEQFVALAENTTRKTERLLLRPLSLADLADYHRYASNPTALRYQYPASQSLAESRMSLVHYNLIQPLGRYGIELTATKQLIGHASIRLIGKQAEIGYILNPTYQHQGYALEAAQALKKICATIPSVQTLTARVDTRNTASIRLLEKLGLSPISEKADRNQHGEKMVTAYYEAPLARKK